MEEDSSIRGATHGWERVEEEEELERETAAAANEMFGNGSLREREREVKVGKGGNLLCQERGVVI